MDVAARTLAPLDSAFKPFTLLALLESGTLSLPARDRPNDKERLFSGDHGLREWRVRRVKRQVFLAGEEAQEGAPLLCHVVTDGAAQHWIASLEGIEDGPHCDLALDVKLDFRTDLRQCSQMLRKHDANHGSVWTSTESTAGKSCTIADQLSPASAET